MLAWRAFILLAIETSLAACLLLVAERVLSEWALAAVNADSSWVASVTGGLPNFRPLDAVLGALLLAGVYWLCQVVGRGKVAYSGLALLVLLPHLPVIWDQGILDWQRFTGLEAFPSSGQSQGAAAGLFLACLIGLFVVHRIGSFRETESRLSSRGVNDREVMRVLAGEAATGAVLVSSGVLAALALILAGNALDGREWPVTSIPWGVAAVGDGATVVLMSSILLLMRGPGQIGRISHTRNEPPDPESN